MLHRFFSRLTPLGGQSLRKSLVALCFLIPLLTQAQNQHRFEGPVEVARWITTHFAQGKLPPFSFYYNERPSAEFIRKWQYKAEKLASDDPAVLRLVRGRRVGVLPARDPRVPRAAVKQRIP